MDASSLYEESDAEEEYEGEKVLNVEVNKRLLEMGLSPNLLKKHKRQLKEKLIQKQIAVLSKKRAFLTEQRLQTHGMSKCM